MKKMNSPVTSMSGHLILKCLLIMKFTLVCLLVFSLQTLAINSHSQEKITLNLREVPLETVFKSIEAQSNYRFVYSEEVMRNPGRVSINVRGEQVRNVLNEVLRNTALSFTTKDNNLILIVPQKLLSLTIRGKVTDEIGNTLPGVSVLEKGTSNGTVTGAQGAFAIDVKDETAILVISYVGYKDKEVLVGNSRNLAIELSPAEGSMDDVVVVGYGTQKRRDVISSMGTVNVQELQKAPVKSFEEALAGRIAGVQVTSSEGGPLASTNIVIRGNSSITQDNSPLWVIDGFPVENPDNNAINPKDIESITILKDAASTAIYGSRGANGVILVTTKSGKAGAPVVAFSGSMGYQRTLRRMEVMDPYEYVKLQTSYGGNTGTIAKLFYTPGDTTLKGQPQYVEGGRTLDYYRNVPYNNWQDLLFRDAPFSDYALSLSGGNEMTKYMLSLSTTSQLGTIINSDFKRHQGKFVLNQQVDKKTKVSMNVNFATTQTNGNTPSSFSTNSPSYSLLFGVWGYRPALSSNTTVEEQLDAEIDPDGQLDYAYNPIINTRNMYVNSVRNNLLANGALERKILNYLTLRITGGVNYTHLRRENFAGSNTQAGGIFSTSGPNGSFGNTEVMNMVNENTLNYSKTFIKKHTVDVLGGFSQQQVKVKSTGAAAMQVPNDNLGVSGLDEGIPLNLSSSSSNNALQSFFGRLNYRFNSTYYLSFTFRADGSSKFAPQNRWGYFPSAAVSWNVAKENFMKRQQVISDLKLRYTYGTSGNNRVSDFAYLSPIYLTNEAHYAFGNTYYKGAAHTILGNEELKWETTATSDLGLDLALWKNRVEFIFDYYRKVTKDLLLQATMPGHTGYASAMKNIGSVENTGYEFTVNTINIKKTDFNWSTNFNIAFNRNKVLSLNSGQRALVTQLNISTTPAFPYIAEVGGPIAQFLGYKWIGNYQYGDFDLLPNGTYVLKPNIAANGTRSTVQPGDIKYEDINGDGTITDADKIAIGSPNPDFIGGFSNNFAYKGIDLNVLFTFSYGNQIYNANRLLFEGGPTPYVNQFASFINRWTPENPTNELPRAGGASTRPYESSRVVEDGSFLRLQTISLGYNLPAGWISRAKLKNVRVHCAAQNLAIWTKYKGSDPEVSTRPGALTQGFDIFAYPRAFTLTFGLNCSF